jgi:dTDP-4-dehydrorhamnose reductase
MSTLILGKGYIGNHLKKYMGDPDKVWGQSYPKYKIELLAKSDLDYTDSETLYEYSLNNDIKTIINTSGYTGRPNVDGCEDNKEDCFKYNVNVPVTIESVCKSLDIDFIHIGSGCIYEGDFKKEFTEDDTPNFGLFQSHSSFYSKTKHISELMLDTNFTNIIRIRMPIESKLTDKNLITKLYKYSNLIDFVNSKTDIRKLCEFISVVKDNFKAGIYNVVHDNALSTEEVTDILKEYGIENKEWKFVDYKKLDIKCNRSNCVLSNEKGKKDFEFDFGDEEYFLRLNASLIQREIKWKKK